MRIVFISDTHNLTEDIVLPEGDLLVHAGDLTLSGKEDECRHALNWLNAQPYKNIVMVAGNHDFAFEAPDKLKLLEGFNKIAYLENVGTEIGGLKIWGSPVTPWFHDWAFNVQRGAPIRVYWGFIPNNLDILITHGPPLGILDQAMPDRSDHLGCEDLAIAVECRSPRIHVFGHIHGSYGQLFHNETRYINASQVNEAYKPVNQPIVIDL